jgi:hypothetical protein
MRYCYISKEMSSLYSCLAVFCLSEARIPEFDTQPLPPPVSCRSVHCVNSGALASNVHYDIKGTVQRDFSTPVFFIKRLILVSKVMPESDFEVC